MQGFLEAKKRKMEEEKAASENDLRAAHAEYYRNNDKRFTNEANKQDEIAYRAAQKRYDDAVLAAQKYGDEDNIDDIKGEIRDRWNELEARWPDRAKPKDIDSMFAPRVRPAQRGESFTGKIFAPKGPNGMPIEGQDEGTIQITPDTPSTLDAFLGTEIKKTRETQRQKAADLERKRIEDASKQDDRKKDNDRGDKELGLKATKQEKTLDGQVAYTEALTKKALRLPADKSAKPKAPKDSLEVRAKVLQIVEKQNKALVSDAKTSIAAQEKLNSLVEAGVRAYYAEQALSGGSQAPASSVSVPKAKDPKELAVGYELAPAGFNGKATDKKTGYKYRVVDGKVVGRLPDEKV
jgi:hypothetical protein